MYHYYLHGELGNRDAQSPPSKVLPNGEPLPDITLQYISESRTMWTRRLVEVDDDLETKMLRAQKSELPFTLDVPGKVTMQLSCTCKKRHHDDINKLLILNAGHSMWRALLLPLRKRP